MAFDHFDRGVVFYLYTQEVLGNQRQVLDRTEPAGDCAGHASATRQFAVRPTSRTGGLRKTSAHLACSGVEAPCPFEIRDPVFRISDGDFKFFSREWRHTNGLD